MSAIGTLKKYLPQEVTLKEDNPRSKYKRGTRWETQEWGWITIIGQCNIPYISPVDGRIRYMWFLVEFDDGVQVVAERPHIYSGKVRNPFVPSFYGVGYLGQGEYTLTKDTLGYLLGGLWLSMLWRCYDHKVHEIHLCYKDCTVDPRWHNFQNFCEDIQELEGYAEWKNSKKSNKPTWHLDKDTKIKGNKVYSKDTCRLITQKENLTEAGLTGKTYIAHRLKDGYTEEFTNQSEFCRRFNIPWSTSLYRVLSGIQKQSHGWTFKLKEDVSE